MAHFVVKTDGTRVPFNSEKIELSIASACQDAQLSDEEKNAVVKEIAGLVLMDLEDKEDVASSQIREMILLKLDDTHPDVSKAWREYDQTKNA